MRGLRLELTLIPLGWVGLVVARVVVMVVMMVVRVAVTAVAAGSRWCRPPLRAGATRDPQ